MGAAGGEKRLVSTLTEAEWYRIEKTTRETLPKVLPPAWHLEAEFANARRYRSDFGVLVIAEVEMIGADMWLHVSFSRAASVPSYDDVTAVKALFVGRRRKAVMVFPSEEEHVNIHAYCLHLYAPLERDPLPDFRMVQGDGRVGI